MEEKRIKENGMKLLNTCLVVAWSLGLASAAYAQNLIVNPGFETGNLTGYTFAGNTNATFVANAAFVGGAGPHTGAYYLVGGESGQLDTISQTVGTVALRVYQLSYFLASDGMTPNRFRVQVNGTTITDQLNIPAQGYMQQVFTVTATTNATNLQFGLQDNPGYLSLDDLAFISTGATAIGTIPNLTANQQAVANDIDRNSVTGAANVQTFITALLGLPLGAIPGALDQLTPLDFGRFTSVTAFNNASFETEAMDNYLASQRSTNGNFIAGGGGIDASGLTLNDPSYDPNLAMVHSRLMAWNPAPFSGAISDVSNPLLGGVDMKDMKDNKEMKSTASGYDSPWNFFVRGNVILAQGFSQTDISHFDDNTESVVLGTDYRITPNFLVGLTAGYGHTDVTLDDNGSSATVDSYSPGLYASYANKGWYADLVGDYVHNAYTQSRVIGFLGQTANSAPEGNEGVANLDGGYDFHAGALTFGPLAGVQYTHLTVDGYSETGSVADLSVNDQEDDSLRSRLGGRISFTFSDCGIKLTPHLDASWQHEFMDGSRGITSQFEGAGLGSFTVRTENPSRDFALADVGLDAQFNSTVTAFADYVIQAGQENYFGQSVQAGVKLGF
jgi:uncharacterized protein YhjY with autotransporter beta-barrel domain